MKTYPVLLFLVLSLVIFSCRENLGEQQKDVHNESKLPATKSNKVTDTLPGPKAVKPAKSSPSRKKIKARDTLKPKIAVLQELQ